MPKKSNKQRSNKKKTRKQKTIIMFGCSQKSKKSYRNKKVFSSLGNKNCPICGPNCHCRPDCNCSHPCSGNCYLNRNKKKQRGGTGCGSCGCPIGGLDYKAMNKFGGNIGTYPKVLNQPVMPDIKGNYQGIIGIGQNGGNCSACGQTQVMSNQSGGNFFKPIGPMPGPIVGKQPWAPNNLPGEKGIGGDANYFKQYDLSKDPSTQQLTSDIDGGYKSMKSMIGGYRYKKSNNSSISSKRGGGLVPQDLVNLGRDFSYNFKTVYNALNGYKAPVDPAPYKGQLTGTLNNNNFYTI